MYGKLFQQMYTGSLATRGPWQAMVTFQQLIILADKDGVVDMTIDAISRQTTIPLEIIRIGIVALEQVDTESRTPTEEGKRIVRLSDQRDWGWRIVNHGHYRKIRSAEERREYMRLYQQQYREKRKPDVNQALAMLAKSTNSSKHKHKAVDVSTNNSQSPVNTIQGQMPVIEVKVKTGDTPSTGANVDIEEHNRAIAQAVADGDMAKAEQLRTK